MGLLDWLFGPRSNIETCDNKAPHEAHMWFADSGESDDYYGMRLYDEYSCPGRP